MYFNDVLEVHKSFLGQGSHANILGDGYLLEKNPVYRKVKMYAEKIGSQFVEAHNEYLLLPFHQLPQILETKKIPYIPSARLMGNIERDRPGVFSTDDVPMPESYHLHEAAHVIADHFLKKVKAKDSRENILKAMLAESFANTVDALACVPAEDDLHYFFIKQNCYMHPQKKVMQAMTSLIDGLGFRFTFMLMMHAYLRANFLTKPLSKKDVTNLLEVYAPKSKVSAKLQKDLRTVCEIGEKLDPLFRVTTTGNYLKQQGFKGDIQDILDFPYCEILKTSSAYQKVMDSLCEVLGK